MAMMVIQLREKTSCYMTKKERNFSVQMSLNKPERMGSSTHRECLALVRSKAHFIHNNGKEDSA